MRKRIEKIEVDRFSMFLCIPEFKFIIVISIAAMSIGNVLVYCSPAAESLINDLGYSSTEFSAINALASISAIAGSPLINIVVTKFGRKIAAICSQIGVVLGWVLMIVAGKKYKWIGYISRIVSGIFIGATSGVIPVYIVELAPEEYRAAYGVMCQLFVSIGAVISYAFGLFAKWRLIAILSLIPCGLFLIFIWFCPDSPVTTCLTNLSASEPIFQKKFILPTIISMLSVIFQQLSGINALLTNLNPIFQASKITMSSGAAAVLVSSAQMISTALSSAFIAKFGDRICWSVSSAGQAVALILSFVNEKKNLSPYIPVICLFFDVFLFGMGLGPIPWFVVAKVFPDSNRALASCLNQSFNWLLCSVMIFAFTPMMNAMTLSWVYFFYGIVMVFSIFYGIFLMPKDEKEPEIQNDLDIDTNPQVIREL